MWLRHRPATHLSATDQDPRLLAALRGSQQVAVSLHATSGEAMIDYHVRLTNQRDLEAFANYIKDALCVRIGASEHFSSIRLSGAPLRYNDFMHPNKHASDAISLAGVVIHEMAHVLVGVQQNHNDHWSDACKALGIACGEPLEHKVSFTPPDFDADALRVIRQAIERFAKDYPDLVYDPNMVIPWPSHVGTYECPDYNVDNGCAKHKVHVMKFQIDGIRQMLARQGNVLLADEMGTGKTVEAMGYIN